MDTTEQIFATGASATTLWVLSWEGAVADGVTWLRLTTSNGATHKGGYGGPSLDPGSPVSVYTGSSDKTPNGAILRVSSDVTDLRVSTSDGATQSVQLARHPIHKNALVAALVYPHGTRITSMNVSDATGQHEVVMTHPQV